MILSRDTNRIKKKIHALQKKMQTLKPWPLTMELCNQGFYKRFSSRFFSLYNLNNNHLYILITKKSSLRIMLASIFLARESLKDFKPVL